MSRAEARREYHTRFKRAINDFHTIRGIVESSVSSDSYLGILPPELIDHAVSVGYSPRHTQLIDEIFLAKSVQTKEPRFSVCARKRPCTQSEEEYDCAASVKQHKLVVHDGVMHRNGRTTYMIHKSFEFDRVFDEHATNDEVFQHTALQMLERAKHRHSGTMLMFGQTGTGKTYTTFGMQQRLSQNLFSNGEAEVEVVCFEMMGTRCFDLLCDRKPVTLLQGSDGCVHARGVMEHKVNSAEQLLSLFDEANQHRAVRAMERNHQSSRSHAITQITLANGARVTLVDLAGSERRLDTLNYSGSDHYESADINSALMTLKQCFHAFSCGAARIPFRAHPLTQLLRHCFEEQNHRTILLTTFSANSSDVDHSLNTIHHVMLMRPVLNGQTNVNVTVECLKTEEEQLEDMRFAQWDPMRIRDFLRKFESGQFESIASAGLDGKQLLRLSKSRLALMCEGDEEGTSRLFDAIREEVRRVDMLVEAKRERISRLIRNRSFGVDFNLTMDF